MPDNQESRIILGTLAYNMVRNFKTLEIPTKAMYEYLCYANDVTP